MTGLSYNRLFNAQVVHDFYVDNISRKDLAFAPTGSTSMVMKNNNMIFRNDESGFRVLYKADETDAPFIDFENVRLVFAVQLKNIPGFLNFTKLAGYKPGKILYFTNIASPATSMINYSLLDYLRPVTFTYTFPQNAVSALDFGHIRISNEEGADVTPASPPNPDPDALVPNASLGLSYPVDLRGMPKGVYKFETWTTLAPAPVETKYIYIDDELVGTGVFGIVDIKVIDAADSSFPGTATPPPPSDDYRLYQLKFERRETQWKYIVVFKSASVNPVHPAIFIEDDSDPDQDPYGHLEFTTQMDAVTVNGFDATIITSNSSAIPYFEIPKKDLAIKKTLPEETLLTNLPGPPLGVVSAQADDYDITEIFVFI